MLFDTEWIQAANQILGGYQTGAVPEFRVVLQVESDDGDLGPVWIVAEQGSLSFSATPMAADCVARATSSVVKTAFDDDDQSVFIERVLSDGSLEIDGDLAKARFFYRGLVPSASPEQVQSLRSLL